MKNDIYFEDKELANQHILELKNKEDVIIEKLKNLVNSEFRKYKKMLNNNIKESLDNIQFEIYQIISIENNYEVFDKKCKTKYSSSADAV